MQSANIHTSFTAVDNADGCSCKFVNKAYMSFNSITCLHQHVTQVSLPEEQDTLKRPSLKWLVFTQWALWCCAEVDWCIIKHYNDLIRLTSKRKQELGNHWMQYVTRPASPGWHHSGFVESVRVCCTMLCEQVQLQRAQQSHKDHWPNSWSEAIAGDGFTSHLHTIHPWRNKSTPEQESATLWHSLYQNSLFRSLCHKSKTYLLSKCPHSTSRTRN